MEKKTIIYDSFMAGQSFEQIGDSLGICADYARQLLKQHLDYIGVDSKKVIADQLKLIRKLKKQAKYLAEVQDDEDSEKKKKQEEYLAQRKSGDTEWVEKYFRENKITRLSYVMTESCKVSKKDIIDYLGGYDNAWRALKYKTIQPVYNWPKVIENGLLVAIIRRMKAEDIVIPKEWGV